MKAHVQNIDMVSTMHRTTQEFSSVFVQFIFSVRMPVSNNKGYNMVILVLLTQTELSTGLYVYSLLQS